MKWLGSYEVYGNILCGTERIWIHLTDGTFSYDLARTFFQLTKVSVIGETLPRLRNLR